MEQFFNKIKLLINKELIILINNLKRLIKYSLYIYSFNYIFFILIKRYFLN